MVFKRLFFALALIACSGVAGLAGCAQGEEIEFSLTSPTLQHQIGQIYISGVNNPGYYPLKEGDSIESLIQAAGGLSEGADINCIELRITETENDTQKIDINRASAWLLETLPGIGAVKAQAIISYRQQNGLFRNINDLLKVEGIGQSTLDSLRGLITVAN